MPLFRQYVPPASEANSGFQADGLLAEEPYGRKAVTECGETAVLIMQYYTNLYFGITQCLSARPAIVPEMYKHSKNFFLPSSLTPLRTKVVVISGTQELAATKLFSIGVSFRYIFLSSSRVQVLTSTLTSSLSSGAPLLYGGVYGSRYVPSSLSSQVEIP
mmetsp:Transcript_18431/g.52034  ORF Transcript_18431/g.52034 Transcript_18431/m.52034 type:complete len:160 (-) Transcript_18431:1005-1484(-)